jgi:hypothetical protein
MLEGIAGIEALGYRRLKELGAPALRSVRSVGGGARNPAGRVFGGGGSACHSCRRCPRRLLPEPLVSPEGRP